MSKIFCESTKSYVSQGNDVSKYKISGQTKSLGTLRCAVLVHADTGQTYLKPWDAFPTSLVRKKGESNPFSKLNNLKVRTLIRDFYTNQFTEEQFNDKVIKYSELYNVSPKTILSVVNGNSWRHVTVNYIKQLEMGNSKVAENVVSAANKVKGNNKLSDHLVKFIVRDFYLNKFSKESLAKKYCVSNSTIGKIITGKLWNETAARKWLYETGMDLISDHLCQEGGKLIYYSKFFLKKINKETFIRIIKEQLEWDDKDIEDALQEVRKLKLSAFI